MPGGSGGFLPGRTRDTGSLDQLLRRLEDRFALLSTGSRVADPRQRTLRALIDWSHDLCSPSERLLWARLSVFTGGFDLDAAEQVCSGDGVERGDVLDLVDRLVSQSVLVRQLNNIARGFASLPLRVS